LGLGRICFHETAAIHIATATNNAMKKTEMNPFIPFPLANDENFHPPWFAKVDTTNVVDLNHPWGGTKQQY
jgi:hypothetical protein